MRKLLSASLLVLASMLSAPSFAAPQCPASQPAFGPNTDHALYAGGAAKISATFCGGSAGYFNTVYLFGDGDNKKIGSGTSANGSKIYFAVSKQGAEIVFQIDVVEYSGNTRTYFSGDTSRNQDGVFHASVINLGNGKYSIGFEDIWGGGDKDFNDAQIVEELTTIGDICDCNAQWNNHGDYVSCVAHAANEFVNLGALRPNEKGPIISEAGQSQCGK